MKDNNIFILRGEKIMKKIKRFFIITVGLILWAVLGGTSKLYSKAATKLNKAYLELL
jgi:hypothetical protein